MVEDPAMEEKSTINRNAKIHAKGQSQADD